MILARSRRILFSTSRLVQEQKQADLHPSIQPSSFDVAVIGGGSAGLAFCNEASKIGLKTVVYDYVDPSPYGTKWGLGGTCVNVGCIPKKLMHRAATLGELSKEAQDFGWQKAERKFDWPTLVRKVRSYIKSLNFSYRNQLVSSEIPYHNEVAFIYDRNTILSSKDRSHIEEYLSRGSSQHVRVTKTKFIVVATGGRPSFPLSSLEKVKHKVLTSDDIFFKEKHPGKTLVLGGGYIAVECAGFLNGLGSEVKLVTRQGALRAFDQDCARYVLEDLAGRGVKLHQGLPKKIEAEGQGFQVWFEGGQERFDSILVAMGRTANTSHLGLERVGVQVNSENKKIKGRSQETELTSVDNIYALGDVLNGVPELTGTAQKAGRLLAHRIASRMAGQGLDSARYRADLLDYKAFPTTVFSPLEYSYCGLSEEEAKARYPGDNIDAYHSLAVPLQQQLVQKLDEQGRKLSRNNYYKLVVNRSQGDKVLGFHYVGPEAGEVIQGMGLALRQGLSKQELDRAIGIHPTSAEQFVHLRVLKSSGESPVKKGC